MSREFGDCHSGGFFHDKVRGAAEDAETGRHEITKAVGALLQALYPLAYAISSAEACDSGEDRPLTVAIEQSAKLRDALRAVDACCHTGREMMVTRSVRDAEAFIRWTHDKERGALVAKIPRSARREDHDYDHWRAVLDRCAGNEWRRLGLPGYPAFSSSMSDGSGFDTVWFADGRSQKWTCAIEVRRLLDEGKVDEAKEMLRYWAGR